MTSTLPHPMTEDPTWRLIRRLGYAGLIPFVFLALCLWLVGPELHPYVALSMQGYGAVIVSFLGPHLARSGPGPLAAHALATDHRGQLELLFGSRCNLSNNTHDRHPLHR
jgi:hypothetical protein